MSKEFNPVVMQYLKNPKQQWNSVGNGNTVTTLYLEKDGVEMQLNDKEINQVLRALQGVNGSIRVGGL